MTVWPTPTSKDQELTAAGTRARRRFEAWALPASPTPAPAQLDARVSAGTQPARTSPAAQRR